MEADWKAFQRFQYARREREWMGFRGQAVEALWTGTSDPGCTSEEDFLREEGSEDAATVDVYDLFTKMANLERCMLATAGKSRH